jgi:cytochrome c-type biogenesis protein CcmH/NrfG
VNAKRVVAILVFASLFYIGLILWKGIYLLTQDSVTLKLYAVAIIVLPLIGGWLIWQEIRFGWATARLARQLPDDDEDQVARDLPRRPSGRIDRKAADAVFAVRRTQVEADPNAWQGWYRLAEAYDLAGDRRRAREAMRTAIARADRAA